MHGPINVKFSLYFWKSNHGTIIYCRRLILLRRTLISA